MPSNILPPSKVIPITLKLPDRPFTPWGTPPPPPVASFTAVPSTGSPPLVVTFTDTSTGDPVSWLWDFGDGTTSTIKNPSHTYITGGTFVVRLSVVNILGQSSTATGSITVNAGDPYADKVIFLCRFNSVTGGVGTRAFINEAATTVPPQSNSYAKPQNDTAGGYDPFYSTLQKKFGSGSLYVKLYPEYGNFSFYLDTGALPTVEQPGFRSTSPATYEFWVYPLGNAIYGQELLLWSQMTSDADTRVIAVNRRSDGTVGLMYLKSAAQGFPFAYSTSTTLLSPNAWHFISVVNDPVGSPGVANMYVDGVLAASQSHSYDPPSAVSFKGNTFNKNGNFDGFYDSIRITKAARLDPTPPTQDFPPLV